MAELMAIHGPEIGTKLFMEAAKSGPGGVKRTAREVAELRAGGRQHMRGKADAADLGAARKMMRNPGDNRGFVDRTMQLLSGGGIDELDALKGTTFRDPRVTAKFEKELGSARRGEVAKTWGTRIGAGALGAGALGVGALGARKLLKGTRGLSGGQKAAIGAGALGAGGLAAMLASRDKRSSVEDILDILQPGTLSQ